MVMHISRMGVVAALFAAGVVSTSCGSARAEESIMKTCGAEWQAAKAGGKVPAGTTWPKFLSDCRVRHASDATAPAAPAAAAAPAPVKPAAAAPAAPAPVKPAAAAAAAPPAAAPPAPAPTAAAPSTTTPAAPAQPTNTAVSPAAPATGGREAMLARERQCGARWKEVKGTAGLPAGVTTWPKYWSWCNTKLKNGQPI